MGRTKGFARCNGNDTDPHGIKKDMYVKPLRKDAPRLLAQPEPLPVTVRPPADHRRAPQDVASLRSLYRELATIPDPRRSPGKKHSVASVLTTQVLAELSKMKGCNAAADFVAALIQKQLQAIGAWQNPKTGNYVPVSKSTQHRVGQAIDPEAFEDVRHRWAKPRIPLARAFAADGKRIRGANRIGAGHDETVTLADHAIGAPYAVLNFHEDGGEIAATQDLLERSDLSGRIITMDARHTTRKTAALITRTANYVLSVKSNARKPAKPWRASIGSATPLGIIPRNCVAITGDLNPARFKS
ncbi:MAG: transposase family protein [Aestuariivita sp.]|nr:transposase family protein [Aestuariivita sp.]MCY4201416.1 transposase family protein [Aestuariivita sp.]